ncbi:MAG: hypothetical protein QOD51_2477 [Candidatus Eremiobacteraeota bacterium]|nr:hypothetical protein [Candidatus Eremiobacteraeota bacterium]
MHQRCDDVLVVAPAFAYDIPDLGMPFTRVESLLESVRRGERDLQKSAVEGGLVRNRDGRMRVEHRPEHRRSGPWRTDHEGRRRRFAHDGGSRTITSSGSMTQ